MFIRCKSDLVLTVLTSLFLFVLGLILGAVFSAFFLANLVAFILFDIILLILAIVRVIGIACKYRGRG